MKASRELPRKSHYICEVVYQKHIENLEPNKNDVLVIDIGVNNIVVGVMNVGLRPLIIKGNHLKYVNQLTNKKNAEIQSIQDTISNTEWSSSKLNNTWKNRNNAIEDIFNEVSRIIIEYCRKNNIGKIIIGYNKEWKKHVNMGKINNQNFTTIPFLKLIKKIKYKGELVGIETILREEGYTSQTCLCGEKSRANRKKRGWFECTNENCPFKVQFGKSFQNNSDVVGAINIGNKEINNLFSNDYVINYLRQSPQVFQLEKIKKVFSKNDTKIVVHDTMNKT